MKVCVIPARGGSKRIPRKNIRAFCGQPVIGYAIAAARHSKLFDHVVVSTEDEEIAQVARELGAQVPFMRPAALADDHTTTRPVLVHALEWFEQAYPDDSVSGLCCIYPVTPFLNATLLQEADQAWREAKADYCMSVGAFPASPYRALKATEAGRVTSIWPQYRAKRTQDLPEAFYDAGMFYFCDPKALKARTPIHSQATVPFVLSRSVAHDIDTLEDWSLAELIYQAHQTHQAHQAHRVTGGSDG